MRINLHSTDMRVMMIPQVPVSVSYEGVWVHVVSDSPSVLDLKSLKGDLDKDFKRSYAMGEDVSFREGILAGILNKAGTTVPYKLEVFPGRAPREYDDIIPVPVEADLDLTLELKGA